MFGGYGCLLKLRSLLLLCLHLSGKGGKVGVGCFCTPLVDRVTSTVTIPLEGIHLIGPWERKQELFDKEWGGHLAAPSNRSEGSAGTIQVNASQSIKVKQPQLAPRSKACPLVSFGAQATDYSHVQKVR